MSSSTREEIAEAYAALRDSVSRVLELSYDVLTTPERLTYLAKQEDEWRRLPAARHELINQLVEQSSEEELGGRLPHALASRLRITRAEASRRIGKPRIWGGAAR